MKQQLKLEDALRVKSAEYWLRLGQPAQALLELQKLTPAARRHRWSTKVLRKSFRAVGATHPAERALVA